jgi:hypothetical protein
MTSSISTYLGYRLYANNMQQSLQNEANQPLNANAAAYYNANIGKVTSVSDFVNNYKLFNYAMTAYGLSDMSYAKAFMTKVLQSNLSDPHSFANSLTDPRYTAFARAFQFQTDGSLSSSAQLQTSTQQSDTQSLFAKNSKDDSTVQQSDTAYYNAHIGSVTSVAALEKDPTLYNYVLTAYGIDPSTPESDVTSALESNPTDPNSFANKSSNAGLKAMAADFNFAADGSVASPRLFQSASAMSAAVSAYSTAVGFDTTKAASTNDTTAQTAAKTATSYYETTIPKITSMNQFLADPKLVAYAIKAYGLPANTTTAQLKSALTSDLTNLKSPAYQLGQAFVNFAGAFNVGTNGAITQTPTTAAQTKAQLTTTNSDYLWQQMETDAGTNEGTGVQLALYFAQMAPSITSAYQILGDQALTKVVQTALGLSPMASSADIDQQASYISSKVNLSQLKDPQYLNQFIDRFSVLYDVQNNTQTNPILQLFTQTTSG